MIGSRNPLVVALVVLVASAAFGQQSSIINSKHNLSSSGPGSVRATAEQEVCIFCHTPHKASTNLPLWNRSVPANAYTVYSSVSLQAKPDQPTGSSKLCLSCHDGTVALGSVLSRDMPISMAGGITTIPAGTTKLGTDLSDDHPISFRFDSALVAKDPKLKDPSTLPPAVRLDYQQNMQCITCHDAHDNVNGKFLVMKNDASQLCLSCHKVGEINTVVGHQNCASCHKPHSAPSGPMLLVGKTVTDTCQSCHGGQVVQAPNLASDLTKVSTHDNKPAINNATPIPNDSTCTSCHEQHSMTKVTAAAPNIKGSMGAISGINSAGVAVNPARYEYEVCYKCHADTRPALLPSPVISRRIVQQNVRLEFNPSAISFHPVEAVGKSTDVPSLRTGWTISSRMYCSDCHASDSSVKAGGTGPNGVHGSSNKPMLIARYDTASYVTESAAAYALCYKCHDRNKILAESPNTFRYHRKHILEYRTSCATCHDAHGISSTQGTLTKNARLINFNTSVVTPTTTGRLEWNQTSKNHGNCYLRCHGESHNPENY